MRYVALLIFSLLLFSTTANALTRTSVAAGDFQDTLTWDCSCIPTATDDVEINTIVFSSVDRAIAGVTINNGGQLIVNSFNFNVTQVLTINVGGTVSHSKRIRVGEGYYLYGTHTGNGVLLFSTGGDIGGNGVFSKTGKITFAPGVYAVDAAAVLNLTPSYLLLLGGATINNNGNMTVGRIIGTGTSTWANRSGSELFVNDYIHTGMRLIAQFANNKVTYQKIGATTQAVKKSNFGYYDLTLKGNGLTTKKAPSGDIVVRNEITFENCTYEPLVSGVIRNLSVGSWNNVSGVYSKRTSKVTFTANAGTINTHLTRASFYEVEFAGSTIMHKQIEVISALTLTGHLDANGYNIHMAGNWTTDITGTMGSGGGEVIFRGNSASTVNGIAVFDNVRISKSTSIHVNVLGQMQIYGSLYLSNGILDSFGNVVIASNSEKTGRLAQVGSGAILGDLVVERYMNFPSNDWRLIGSSVLGTTVGSWSGDFITTGYPGSDYPSFYFNNVTRYNEVVAGHKDLGFMDATSSAEVILQGEGRRAYIAAGYNKLSVSGIPIIGPFGWNLSYTPTGDSPNDGWNLICNPYPSSIDWDKAGSWTKTGVKDAIYVWGGQDGTYTSYIAGLGTNGGTQFIPSSQAFWVQTDEAGPALSLVESAKSMEDEVFRTVATQFFKIRMTTSNGLSDEVAVRAHHEATLDFDRDWDAYEFRSADAEYPSLSLTSADNVDLSIYSLAQFEEAQMIPMPLYVGTSGEVGFIKEGGEDFPAKQCRLFDLQENKYYRIDSRGFAISLDEGEYLNRFFLVLDPLYDTDDITSTRGLEAEGHEISAWISNDHIAIQNASNGSSTVNITVYNGLGQVLLRESAIELNGRLDLDAQLFDGMLIIQIDDLDSGSQYIERLVK